MSLTKEQIERMNKGIAKAREKNKPKRDALIQAFQGMADREKARREREDEYEREKYHRRLIEFKGYIKRRGGILTKREYYIDKDIKGYNPLDGRGGWEIFGEFLRGNINYKEKWDHYPTDEELYEFIYKIYGEPKYLTRKPITDIKVVVGGKPMGVNIDGEYRKFERENDDDLTVEDALKKL